MSSSRATFAGRIAAVGLATVLALAIAAGAAPASPPRCSTLTVWAGRQGAAAGSIGATYAFVNAGRTACTLEGRPGVTLLDARGRPLTSADRLDTSFGSARAVPLRPGARAYFLVFFSDGGGYVGVPGYRRCPTSSALALTPPGATRALVLRGRAAQIAPYGSRAGQCGLMLVSPLAARAV